MQGARTVRWFVPITGLLIGTAWAALWMWEQSPYGRYLDHGRWTEIGFAASICRVVPAGDLLLPGFLYVGGWLLMSAAMMLPTALPLLHLFDRLTAARPNRLALVGLLIMGYLLVWASFGVVVHLLDAALQAAVGPSGWLPLHGWLLGAIVLAIAGVFQFSRLKYHCLDKCRTPFSFIAQHWSGPTPRLSAFRLGLHHGMFCVGCCWAIMLLMFVVGTGNVGWMLILGAIMALEKNAPWGRRLSHPLGLALLAWAGAIIAGNMSV
ncbi:MAG: putative transrane protein [Rhodospirillales bacterium]|jgi:predicted metal-binding membrane protein|nr:putative transrane protein [Rhodospirillales bacterium]